MAIFRVIPNLWFGGRQPLSAAEGLAAQGIRIVINLSQKPDPNWPAPLQGYEDGLPDDGTPKPNRWFDRAESVISHGLTNHVGVLVHCEAGIHRSPSIIMDYLERHGHPQNALDMIKHARPEANPIYRRTHG